MKKTLIFVSGILLVGALAAFTLSVSIYERSSELLDDDLTISMCGPGFDSDTSKSKPRNDCHSPVTSYVDHLPSPAMMTGIGTSHIKVTTKSDSAQKYFDQGLSLLHDFWDFEAYRAFKYAIKLDSTLAMAHWGLAMSIEGSSRETEFKAAISNAKKYLGKASAQEKLYIKALLAKDSVGGEKGGEIFRSSMEKIIYQFPNDPEARLILWLKVLDGGYDGEGDPKKDAMYSQLMLEKLMITNPDHPGVHHYWIHQMENCCPEQAVKSADILASLTPKSGHMVHMPGHIYYRTGDYKKARKSFIASMKVDSAYMAEQNIQQLDNWNYPHNLHYLIANCAEEGKYTEAAQWHKRLEDIPSPYDSIKDRLKSHRNFAFVRKVIFGADLEIRFGLWSKVVERYSKLSETDSMFFTHKENPVHRSVLIEYAKGMLAIENKKYDQAKQSADALDALLWRNIRQDKVDVWSGSETKFNIQSLELRGNLLSATGDYKKALELLERARELEKTLGYQKPPPYARPIAESIAQAHIRAKEFSKARETYEGMLRMRPNSGFALYGIAQTYELAGNKAEAAKFYKQFKTVWNEADSSLPQVKKADAWLKANKI